MTISTTKQRLEEDQIHMHRVATRYVLGNHIRKDLVKSPIVKTNTRERAP